MNKLTSTTNELKDTKNLLQQIKSSIEPMLAQWNKSPDYFGDSLVLSSQPHRTMVANFIKDLSPKFILVLVYRGTRDGWTADNIHQRIDAQGPTVTLVKTNKGKIFGGFTTASWDKSSGYKSDTESFVFSVDLSAKYPVDKNQTQKAICCHSSYGPNFGYCFFYVNANA